MFVKDGITYYEIGDLADITSESNKLLTIKSNGVGGYIQDSALANAIHTHTLVSQNGGEIRVASTGRCDIEPPAGQQTKIYGKHPTTAIQVEMGTNGTLRTSPAATNQRMFADAFVIHASFAEQKTNISEFDGEDDFKKFRPLTFEIDGIPQAGFIVDELQACDLPGVVTRDNKGVVDGYNPLALLTLVVERLQKAEKRIETLETLVAGLMQGGKV